LGGLDGATAHTRKGAQFFRGAFAGYDAAEWFMQHLEGVANMAAAQAVGQKFVDLGVFASLSGSTVFEPSDRELYQFQEYDSAAGTFRRSCRAIGAIGARCWRGGLCC
jgi:hypothetical protein